MFSFFPFFPNNIGKELFSFYGIFHCHILESGLLKMQLDKNRYDLQRLAAKDKNRYEVLVSLTIKIYCHQIRNLEFKLQLQKKNKKKKKTTLN